MQRGLPPTSVEQLEGEGSSHKTFFASVPDDALAQSVPDDALAQSGIHAARIYWQQQLDMIILVTDEAPAQARVSDADDTEPLRRVSLADAIVASVQPRLSRMESRLSAAQPDGTRRHGRQKFVYAMSALLAPASKVASKVITLTLTGTLV